MNNFSFDFTFEVFILKNITTNVFVHHQKTGAFYCLKFYYKFDQVFNVTFLLRLKIVHFYYQFGQSKGVVGGFRVRKEKIGKYLKHSRQCLRNFGKSNQMRVYMLLKVFFDFFIFDQNLNEINNFLEVFQCEIQTLLLLIV